MVADQVGTAIGDQPEADPEIRPVSLGETPDLPLRIGSRVS
jgi:hypothetical protein